MRTIIGPHGEKRPADVASNAVHVGRLLVGDIEETYADQPDAQYDKPKKGDEDNTHGRCLDAER